MKRWMILGSSALVLILVVYILTAYTTRDNLADRPSALGTNGPDEGAKREPFVDNQPQSGGIEEKFEPTIENSEPLKDENTADKSSIELYQFLMGQEFSYKTIKEKIGKNELPTLYKLLNNPIYFRSWGNAATAIGLSGGDLHSFDILEDFVTRPIEYEQIRSNSPLTKADSVAVLVGKISAFRWLPFLEQERGSAVLKSVLTDKEAARAYLSRWPEEQIPSGYGDLDRASLELQAAAAEGLILSDVKANLEFVTQQFRIVDDIVASIPTHAESPNTTELEATQNGYATMFLASLAGVLAKAGYIEEHGLQTYLNRLGSMEIKHDLQFRLEKLLDESSVYQ